MRSLWIALAAFAGVASADGLSAAAERGRYVATAANCVSCHTREGGPEYAGGRPLATPLGTIYATNITPDRETGIGSWSAADLKRALREGIAADGRHLFPAFPYTFYTRLADADIADLYAYLRTLKPVRYVPPENDRAFRIRLPMAAWKALNLDGGAYKPDPARSAAWNRGAYLVQGPGHCGACHTARTWTLAEESSAPLRGAVMRDEVKGGGVRDWFAVDLAATKQGLGGWSTGHIVDYLGKGFSTRAGSFGPMNAVIANSTRHLRPEDLRAIAVYLQSLDGADYAGPAAAAEQGRAGRPLYEEHCSECHGDSGRGGLFDGPPVAGSAIVQGEDASSLVNIILHGSDRPDSIASPAWETMPAFDRKLDDAEIAALANYLRASWGNRAPPVTASDVARQRVGD
ncbi:MAG TPA: cytochrome c [Steroidobacteraceae bacterium]|nr:cytochrome c [Steroidobacteraceae bacterium]